MKELKEGLIIGGFFEICSWLSGVTGTAFIGFGLPILILSIWFVLSCSKEEAAKQAEKNRIKNLDPNSKEYQEKYMGLKSLTH